MKYLTSLKNKDLSKQTCLLRVDFNIQQSQINADLNADKRGYQRESAYKISENPRLKGILPTINFLISRGARVVILSHRGRPQSALRTNPKSKILNPKQFSLRPFAKILSFLLKKPVKFIDLSSILRTSDAQNIKNSPPGSIFLAENLRFLPGEEKNDDKFAKQLASLGDFYVNDAFAVSHRKNASVVAITKYLPSYAGLLLEKEIKNLNMVVKNQKKPFVVILGGAKISDKIGLIKNFLKKVKSQGSRVNCFLLGGGIANTMIAAQGLPVGDSLYDTEPRGFIRGTARKKEFKQKIILPVDVVIENRKILDIGLQTIKKYSEIIKKAKTIIWNGPMGYIENPKFTKGSEGVLKAILKSKAFSVIGGGETTTLVSNVKGQMSNVFLSTGGGAMLEYLAGKKLPGITALNK